MTRINDLPGKEQSMKGILAVAVFIALVAAALFLMKRARATHHDS
jgi:hypothetical protein